MTKFKLTNRQLIPLLYLLAFVFVLFTGTSCTDEPASKKSSAPSITTDGVLSGTIVDFNPAYADSICVRDITSSIIGQTIVSQKGYFSLQLANPHLNKSTTVWDPLVLSDSTSYTGVISSIDTYKNRKLTGFLMKINIANLREMSTTKFYYSTAWYKIKGTFPTSDTRNYNTILDLTLNKGWSEITYAKTDSVTYTVSNKLYENYDWVYFYIR